MTAWKEQLRSERGSSTVELAVLAPLALLLVLCLLQAGLWWHTRSACTHAAARGAAVARTTGGTPALAHQAAAAALAPTSTASSPTVDVQLGPQVVTVRVAATAPWLVPLPGLTQRLVQTVTAPKEHRTTPGAA